MKHVLINGCSYAQVWNNYQRLTDRLGAGCVKNIARSGSSNDRILRTTFEYISTHRDVDFLILMLTYNARYEGPWRIDRGTEEGNWLSYTSMGISMNKPDDEPNIDLSTLDQYIEKRFIHDHDSVVYTDKMLMNLILLITWLKTLDIKYCVINTCDDIYTNSVFKTVPRYRRKLDALRSDPSIVKLDSFISNQWMHDQGAKILEHERHISPEHVHYGEDGYAKLNDFLYTYIVENCL